MNESKNCPDPQELNAFFDGELSGDTRQQVSLHLECCESCRDQLQVWEGLSQSLGLLEIDASGKDRVLASLLLQLPESQPPNRGSSDPDKALRPGSEKHYIRVSMPAAAAVLLLLAGSLFFNLYAVLPSRTGDTPPPPPLETQETYLQETTDSGAPIFHVSERFNPKKKPLIYVGEPTQREARQ